MLANRYKNNKLVAGADLRNEVRTTKVNSYDLSERTQLGLRRR